jgi:DNA polymerase-3 subunit delta
MAALSYDALMRGIKRGEPDPVYYLYGEEHVLKDEAVRALVDRLIEPSMRDFNLDVRAATEQDAESLHALLNTLPMLAERRVVVLRGVEQLRKKSKPREALLAYLKQPSPSTVLILVQGDAEPAESDLAAAATAVDAAPLPPERAVRWVLHAAGQNGLTVEPEAADRLVEVVGPDLGALRQELEKLSVIVQGRAVGPSDVSKLVGVRHGETVQDFVRLTLERHPARAAGLVERVLMQAGMTGVRIVMALGTALVGTALARAELDRGVPHARLTSALVNHMKAARPFGIRGYGPEAERWANWCQRWTALELRRALQLTLATDKALKASGVSDEGALIRQLALSLPLPAQEAA